MSLSIVSTNVTFLTEKVDFPAFSFFFRLHSGSEKQLHDPGHMLSKCQATFKNANLETAVAEKLQKHAEQLIENIDLTTGAKSVGLFISKDNAKSSLYYTYLPERQYQGEYYSCLESLYAEQESNDYLLFILESRSIKTFTGKGDHLESLSSCPSIEHLLSTYKNKDISHLDKAGRSARGADLDPQWKADFIEALAKVCSTKKRPAFLVGLSLIGVDEEELKKAGITVLASDPDVHQTTGGNELTSLANDLQNKARLQTVQELIEQCNTAIGAHKFASGKDEMLNCAKEGRTELLILETPSWEKSGLVELTTLHETARETLTKNGNVTFVPSDTLKKWNGACMILRY